MFKVMKEFEKKGTPSFSLNNSEHLKMVLEQNYAYIASSSIAELESLKHCEIATIKEKFSAQFFAVGLQNNSAYNDIFSQQ